MSAESNVAVDVPAEDVVAKYKRLLTMARSSLEANQATLAQKDRHISQLLLALEEEKAKRAASQRHAAAKEEDSQIPRNILRRVDVDDVVWVLMEYEGADDGWISFASQQELEDHVQRIPGAPLEIPPRSLTPEESARFVSAYLVTILSSPSGFRCYPDDNLYNFDRKQSRREN
jgi:hypothetical protein